MTEDELDLEGDAEALTPSQDALASVSELVRKQLYWEEQVNKAEAQLKACKENLRNVSERELPEALITARLKEFVTDDGMSVKIEDELTMSIPKKNKAIANAWLEANGLGGLIKPVLIVELRKGEHNAKAIIAEFLDKHGFSYVTEDTANTTSVKAVFNKRMEEGKLVDLELFGGFHRKVAVIKLPKD